MLFNFEGPEKGNSRKEIRGYSSAGRAPALQAGGQRFDPVYLHQSIPKKKNRSRLEGNLLAANHGLIAQPVRAHA